MIATIPTVSQSSSESLWQRLQQEAIEAIHDEPELRFLLHSTILAPEVNSFEEAVAMTVAFRLLGQVPCPSKAADAMNNALQAGTSTLPPIQQASPVVFCPHSLYGILKEALLNSSNRVLGHTMSEAVQKDVMAVLDRDPACDTVLEVVLFMKGFSALVSYRAAHQKWILTQQQRKERDNNTSLNKQKKSWTALFLQSQASAVFGVDIHPGAVLGAGILLDHGTGIVIGETAVVGDGCTLLHGVTLGGTGKDHGDRHPKIGPHVLIGTGAKILGNIVVGASAKIGAGSIVLRPIPAGATAVGAPAKIIGRALELDPAQNPDSSLDQVGMLHKSLSDRTLTTTASYSTTTDEDGGDEEEEEERRRRSSIDSGLDLDKMEINATSTNASHDESRHPEFNSSIDIRLKNGRHGELPPGCMCPYRDYAIMAMTAPKGSITICSLGKVMKSYECTSDEVGSTFFELDSLNVGHFYWAAVEDRLGLSLERNTRLSPEQIHTIMDKLRAKHEHVLVPVTTTSN
jgi:serine O-acetyltransferase